jgi:pimeloyl-ACP methyl ester carboxylesterase
MRRTEHMYGHSSWHEDRSGLHDRGTRRSRLLWLVSAWSMIGMAFLSSANAADSGAFTANHPPGRLIDIGTHRLHIYCVGHESPTVILDAGLGGSALEWLMVQRRLAPQTRACAYDRAGYGWSDPGSGPRTSRQNALELRALLAHADVEPPYVMVGHSYGGYDMQLFASIFPKLVAALVLVDSSHPDQVERFEAKPIGVSTAPQYGASVLVSQPSVPANIPVRLAQTVTELMSSRKSLEAIMGELRYFRLSATQVRNAPHWPDIPTVVLTRGNRVWPQDRKGDLMEALWMQLQTELATRNPHSLHILIRNSGHHIHLDRPALVARAVLLATNEYRDSPSLRKTPLPRPAQSYQVAYTFADDTLLSDLHGAQ